MVNLVFFLHNIEEIFSIIVKLLLTSCTFRTGITEFPSDNNEDPTLAKEGTACDHGKVRFNIQNEHKQF